jgi:transposase-like protein
MQFQINAAGRRIYPSEFKRKILEELRAGATAHELGRKHGMPIQSILNWRKLEETSVLGKRRVAPDEETVSASDYRKALEEIRNLRRSLVNMTVDRDILKEAHEIAVKKKWISPAK